MSLDTSSDQRRRIFAFTGLPGVGKSAVVKKVAQFNGYPVINMGAEMKAQYETMPFGDDRKETPEKTWDMATALRIEHGDDGAALASISRIAAGFVENNVLLVDGVRSVAEVECFEQTFGCPVHLVHVHASEETRLQRFAERAGYYEAFEGMDDGEQVAEAIAEYEMIERTKRESEAGLREALQYANYAIDNDGTLADAERQVLRLLDDFLPLT